MVHCAQLVSVIKVDGKVMREVRENDSNVVYIPFGSEYEITFNNLSNYRAVVKVEIDGKDVLSGHSLVIDSNSEGLLKGKLDKSGGISKNRFKFIKMTDRIAEHRGTDARDGLIRIEWQYEQPYRPPIYIPNVRKVSPWVDRNLWHGSIIGSQNVSGSVRGASCGNSAEATFSCSTQNINQVTSAEFACQRADSYENSDKGITAAGSIVNQKFGSTYVRDLFPEKHVVVFELRGENKKGTAIKEPRTVKHKVTCETCGRHNKSSSKFCAECGTCLI